LHLDSNIVREENIKINLLHIISSLQVGGAEKQVVKLLKELDRNKYRITLCCFRKGGLLESELEDEDINLVFIGMRLRYFYIALYKLVSLIKKEHIQIVHTHLYDCSFWGRIAAWIAGVPVIIVTEHGRGLWKKRLHLIFERIADRFTDIKIAVSEDIRQIRIQRENTPKEKVVMVPNSINPNEYIVSKGTRKKKKKELGFKESDLVIGTIARFHDDKGLDNLLKAFVLVQEKIDNVYLTLVGDGQLRAYLENYAIKLGIVNKVIFAGICTDIASFLSIMDIFVNSSIREGISVSLLEAMAAKKAVVVTNVGGNPEVVNSNSVGIIVPPKNSKALADGIIYLLENKTLREKIGLKAHERIQMCFSLNMQAKKIEAIYEELLSSKC
jgi:glycosyltransferase involved in cell wall biosynthesis